MSKVDVSRLGKWADPDHVFQKDEVAQMAQYVAGLENTITEHAFSYLLMIGS